MAVRSYRRKDAVPRGLGSGVLLAAEVLENCCHLFSLQPGYGLQRHVVLGVACRGWVFPTQILRLNCERCTSIDCKLPFSKYPSLPARSHVFPKQKN